MMTLGKLCRAVSLGYDRLEPVRKLRRAILEQYVTRHYSGSRRGAKASPVNPIFTLISTYVANLAYRNPRYQTTTPILPYRNYASTLAEAVNHVVREIRLRDPLRVVLIDALTSFGMFKTGIAASALSMERHGSPEDSGQVYADRVDVDDAIWDPLARRPGDWVWVGNRFRERRDVLLNSEMFDPAVVETLPRSLEESSDHQSAESLSDSDRSASASREAAEIYDYVDLAEIYIPSERIIVTIPWKKGHSGYEKPLRVVGYEGPEWGPYHMLGLSDVPNNVRGVPMAAVSFDLHELANRTARRIADMAKRAKRILAYEPMSVGDAKSIDEAMDDDKIAVENVDGLRELNYGGVTDDSYRFMDWCDVKFSTQSGNLNQLSGQRSDVPTATQAEILNSGQALIIEDHREQFAEFVSRIGGDIAFYLHTDPLVDMILTKRAEGVDMPIRFTPAMREGDWLDYNIRVVPRSMARRDPNLQLRRLLDFYGQAMPGIAQTAQILGPMFRIDRAVPMVLREMDIDEADEMIDTPAMQQWAMQWAQAVPPDGKLGQGSPGGPGGAGGGRPQQPNPMQMGPSGGVSPEMERRQMQQATGGELQRTYVG